MHKPYNLRENPKPTVRLIETMDDLNNQSLAQNISLNPDLENDTLNSMASSSK
jgi:hypothetical protein